jgi:lipoate-protein ligase A
MKFDFSQPEALAKWLDYRAAKFADGTTVVFEVHAVRVIELELEPGQTLTAEELRERIVEDFRQSVAASEDAGIASLSVLETKP